MVDANRARKLLDTYAKNRKIRKRQVKQLAEIMKKGEWFPKTGETLKITDTRKMIDGQHRMEAIILSDTQFPFLIAWDLPEVAIKYIDQGIKRTGGDILHMEGVRNSYNLSGIIRTYLLMKTGRPYATRGSGWTSGVQNADILDEYQRRPDWWQGAFKNVNYWYRTFERIFPPAGLGGFYAWFCNKNRDDAFTFMDMLFTGTELKKNHPIWHLRQTILANSRSRQKLVAYDMGALIIKAWNHWRNGEDVIKELTFDHKKENYPKPV